MLVSQRVPNVSQIQGEACHRSFALNRMNVHAGRNLTLRTVDFHRLVLRVNEPARLRALLHIIAQLLLQHLQSVGVRFHLNHEVGTKMPERFSHSFTKLPHAALQSPRRIGRAPGTVRKHKACGGGTHNSTTILLRPMVKFGGNCGIGSTGIGMTGGHSDQFTLCGHFKVEVGMFDIGMFGAKRGEFLIRHWAGRKRGRKKNFIDCQRRGFSLPRVGRNG